MAIPHGFDISTLDSWHGLRPGMPRTEAMALIEKAGLKTTRKADEPDWLRVDGTWGMELRFNGENGSERVWQLSVEDERKYAWHGKKLLGAHLHQALQIVKQVAGGAGWRVEDAVCEPNANPAANVSDPPSNELLLSEGTLWLPDKGLGLVMADGVVTDVVWRDPSDVPRPFASRLTDEQLELSRRPDLGEHLLASWKQRIQQPPPSRNRNVIEVVLAILLVLSLAYIGWKAWQEMMSWQKAANVPGRVLNIENKTGKRTEKLYHVEYTDPSGHNQVVTLERPDFYVEPREIGETVIVCVVGDAPPHVRGPARAKDAAFLTYMPWAIGLMAVYFIARLVLYFWAPGLSLKAKVVELLK
jgi:hypothetical protein